MASRIPKEFKKRLWDDWVSGKTFKLALFRSTSNCNTDGISTYAACNNEVTNGAGTAYTAGGATVTPAASAYIDTVNVSIDATDISWSSATLSGARYAVLYETTIDIMVCVYDLLADYSVINGTLSVSVNVDGLFNLI